MDMKPRDWLSVIDNEYLKDFIKGGGAAVKFALPMGVAERSEIEVGLKTAADANGFQFSSVDAARTRVQLVDKLFHEVARQIAWDELARCFALRLLTDNGREVPVEPERLDLAHIAALNQYEEVLLRRDVKDWLAAKVFRDYEMCQEFRFAMMRLCLAQLDPRDVGAAESAAIKEWLRGELRLISALKPALIYQKIARHNARHMLCSLAHWLRLAGRSGLVLLLDVSRCTSSRKLETDDGLYYSKPAALDVYELLRQFVDGVDELGNCLVVVVAAPDFLTEPSKGVNRYQALHDRIRDEVYDRYRPNPLAALVRLSGAAEQPRPAYLPSRIE